MFGWLLKLVGAEKREPPVLGPVSPQPPARRVLSAASAGTPVFREFYDSVAGVTFSNPDGRLRQDIIRRSVYAGMPLTLLLEDDNPHDKNAVALFTPDGHQIGYLNQRAAGDARDHIDRGRHMQVTVSETTGGTPDRPTNGVNILVKVLADPVELPMRAADFRKAITAAKREGQYRQVEAWLLQDVAEREKPFGAIDTVVSSWPYEQLANLYRQQKRWADEVAILTRYFLLPEARRMTLTDRLQHRFDKAANRLKAGLAEGGGVAICPAGYLNDEMASAAIVDTVQPGTAMTVKEAGAASATWRAFSPDIGTKAQSSVDVSM